MSNGIYGAPVVLFNEPSVDVLTQFYASALFWRYVQEQYSFPVPSLPHPSGGTASNFSRTLTEDLDKPLADRPFSDQGIDFIGRLFFALSVTPSGISTVKSLDGFLAERLGRDLPSVVQDLHTAMVLKDFTDSDPRWRFDWAHGGGYRATTILSAAKPFTVPLELYGSTCFTLNPVCDGLPRTRRVLDAWLTPTSNLGVAVADTLPLGQARASLQPVGVSTRGVGVLSVAPGSGWIGQDLPVEIKVGTARPLPRVRVFRVQAGAGNDLVPEPVCGAAPGWNCPLKTTPFGFDSGTVVPVPVTAETREVIAIVSGSSGPATFEYRLGGTVQPQLGIVEPTARLRAHVGSAQFRRSFLVKLSYRDQQGNALPAGKVAVNVPGCALASCVLPPSQYKVIPLTGGNLFVVASLPASFYPSGGGLLDLSVSLGGLTATRPSALEFGEGVWTESVVVALDRSGSMQGAKLQAAKTVAKVLLSSLLPPSGPATSSAGLVGFFEDAVPLLPGSGIQLVEEPTLSSTMFPAIDALAASGGVSLGDAVFEAQSLLAKNFDPPAPFVPDRASIILIASGKNTHPAFANEYYLSGLPPDSDPAGPPWHAGPLQRTPRAEAGLQLPVVSAVAIGSDAEVGELDVLAKVSGGTRVLVPVAGSTQAKLLGAMGDAVLSAYNAGADFDRVVHRVTNGSFDEPIAIDLEPGTSMLRLNLLSAVAGAATGVLLAPGGESVDPTGALPDGTGMSFAVSEPVAGRWLLLIPPVAAEEPPIALEVAVRGPTRLFTVVDVEDVLPIGDATALSPAQRGGVVGSDVMLRAVPWSDGAVIDCDVSSTITPPDGVEHRLTLRDDGRHGDGEAGDGVYGAIFPRTAAPGMYAVRTRANCSPDADLVVQREKHEAFVLQLPPEHDEDADGIPDSWVSFHDLTALGDADADNLTDADEFAHGTNPRTSDTDAGGESDASEVLAGRDPRDPSDDVIGVPTLVPVVGFRRVLLPATMSTEGVTLVVERGAAPGGPFTRPSSVNFGPGYAVDQLPDDAAVCYRMRAVKAGATSGWSEIRCVTPRLDPVAPVIRRVLAPRTTLTREIEVNLAADDFSTATHGVRPPVDLLDVSSGLAEFRVSFGVDPDPDAPWLPFAEALPLRLPDQDAVTLRVQVRDLAGNVSEPRMVRVIRPRATPFGEAVALEERAEDLLVAGDVSAAAAAVKSSLTPLNAALVAVAKQAGKKKESRADRVHAVKELAAILGMKAAAAALLATPQVAKGRALLDLALSRERELAHWAALRGFEL